MDAAFFALSQYLCSPVVSLTQTTARLFHPPMSIRPRKFFRPRSKIFCCISFDNHSSQGFPALCGMWPFRNVPFFKFRVGRPFTISSGRIWLPLFNKRNTGVGILVNRESGYLANLGTVPPTGQNAFGAIAAFQIGYFFSSFSHNLHLLYQ